MTGANDPDCRGAFIWEKEKQDEKLLRWYRRLTALRKGSEVLRKGSFTAVLCEGRTYGFARSLGEEELYVLLNAGEKKEAVLPVASPGKYKIIFSDREEEEGKTIRARWAEDGGKNSVNGDRMDCQGRLELMAREWSVLVMEKEKEERGYEE